MNNPDIDLRLRAFFDKQPLAADPVFTRRVLSLAALDQAERRARRRIVGHIARETLALGATLGTFTMLARAAPAAADFGDIVPLSGPAMLGLTILVLWALVSLPADALER